MKVYRIENEEGQGPFRTNACKDHHYEPPGPATDNVFGDVLGYFKLFKTGEVFHYNYGFQTKYHLNKWFPQKDLKWLEKKGYSLFEYDIPHWKVHFGGHQCAFKKKDAIKFNRIDIDKLYH
jgi:hypothetical protein